MSLTIALNNEYKTIQAITPTISKNTSPNMKTLLKTLTNHRNKTRKTIKTLPTTLTSSTSTIFQENTKTT